MLSKKYSEKQQNLACEFGKGIISFIEDKPNADQIQQLMKIKSKKAYKEEFENMNFTLQDFQKWVKENNIHEEYVKFETFKVVWGFHLLPNNAMGLEDRFFCCVLKRITKHYLNNKFYKSMFNKVEINSEEKTLSYLKKVYILARGLEHPEKM